MADITFDLLADISLATIRNPSAKITLLALAKYSNNQGVCFPSQATLASDTGLNSRTIQRSINWLEANGYIRISTRKGASNTYTIIDMEDEHMTRTPDKLSYEVDNILDLNSYKDTKTPSPDKLSPLDTHHFRAFWQEYPRRQAKGAARVAFAKATKLASPSDIIEAAKVFSQWCEHTKVERRYIPLPTTWLNQERWDDELEFDEQDNQQQQRSAFLNDI